MINTLPSALLMIEPACRIAPTPIIDDLTRRMTAALRAARLGTTYRGCHQSTATGYECDPPWSGNADLYVRLLGGVDVLTNSLAVHYLAYCRHDVPDAELAKVAMLPLAEADPTEDELMPGGLGF